MSLNTDYLDYKLNSFFYSLSERMWQAFAEDIKEQGRLSSREHDLALLRESERKASEIVSLVINRY